MSNVGFFTWWKFGRPAAGQVNARGRIGARADSQGGLAQLIEQNFGAAQELAAIDLGAGDGESPLGRQVLDIPWKRLTAVEAFIPYVHRLQAKMPKAGQFEVIEERVEKVVSDLRPAEYDLALLLDLLGHLSAAESLQVLRRLEKLVRGIVIFSPLGKYKPPPDDQNALQHVKSYWKAGDFSKLGYAVTILEGHLNHTKPPADAAWAVKSIAAAK